MRVRVWIAGADGPSRDFELVDAPRVGEHISIAVSGKIEEGVVRSVSWQLLAIESSGPDLALAGEPLGSVSMIHVICGSPTAGLMVSADHAAEAASVSARVIEEDARP
jgi:hypothetical protein